MSDTPRPELVDGLEALFPGARLLPLAGDASTRAFLRLFRDGGPSLMVMDYGAPFDHDPNDVVLNRVFREAGLRVATIEHVLGEPGCLVLEDLGDRMLESALQAEPARQRALLEQAVRLAAAVADLGSPALTASSRADGPALDAGRFRFEMDFFVEHYIGAYLGRAVSAPELRAALHRLAQRAADTPRKILCHRDFHSRNLMLTDEGELAMVDIQDARWGPDSYDLASLLRDAYLDIDEEQVPGFIDLYLAERSDRPDPAAFRERFDIVSAQRMIKALGSFGYLIAVRGRPRYEDAIPRTLARLERLLPDHAETAAVHGHLKRAGVL